MRISIEEISRSFEEIIALYRFNGIDSLDFNTDLYLKFLPEEWNKVGEESILPAIGSIDDDITCLKDSLERGFFTTLDLERICAILYGSVCLVNIKE